MRLSGKDFSASAQEYYALFTAYNEDEPSFITGFVRVNFKICKKNYIFCVIISIAYSQEQCTKA
jgi:hypothetical protein